MTTLIRPGFLLLVVVTALAPLSEVYGQTCAEGCIGQIGVGGDTLAYEMCMSRCNGQGPGPSGRGPDPCFIKQNAMRPCTKEQNQSKTVGVDPNLLGTWELPLNGGLWVWEILKSGTYRFHSDAKDGAPAHSGTFSATNGLWELTATTGIPGYTDKGNYTYQPPDIWIATGKWGTSAWRRAAKTEAPGGREGASPRTQSQELPEGPITAVSRPTDALRSHTDYPSAWVLGIVAVLGGAAFLAVRRR